MKPESWPELMSGKTLCRYLGISRDLLSRLRCEATFPGFIYSKYYSKRQVDAWLEGNSAPRFSPIDLNLEADKFLSALSLPPKQGNSRTPRGHHNAGGPGLIFCSSED